MLIWFFLEYTRFGRMMYAVGSNERAAELAGAPVKAYKIWAYVISGIFASIGGILLAARLGRGDIASGNNLLLDSVAAALIGFAVLGAAKPNAFGTAIGALFVGILLQGLTMMNAPYYTQDFVKGIVLVVALVFTFALSNAGTTARIFQSLEIEWRKDMTCSTAELSENWRSAWSARPR